MPFSIPRTFLVMVVVGAAAAIGLTIAAWLAQPANAGAARPMAAPRNGRLQQFWPDGRLKVDAGYRDDAYDGEYRSYYQSGAPYELRHYVNGHEDGVQQSWTEDGVLYLNYDVHDGRRYGLVNATPCTTVGDASGDKPADQITAAARDDREAGGSSSLPYYESALFTPHWQPVSHHVAPFDLRTQTGARISDASLRGRPYVASFVYTRCAAVCPLVLRQLSRVQQAFPAGPTRIVSFTVTPDTDTPAVLAQFGREQGIDPGRWALVTGNKRTIYTLARTSYFADDSRVGPDSDDAAFLHTEKLLLVDGNGQLRGVYNGTQPHAVDQLIADIARLESEL